MSAELTTVLQRIESRELRDTLAEVILKELQAAYEEGRTEIDDRALSYSCGCIRGSLKDDE